MKKYLIFLLLIGGCALTPQEPYNQTEKIWLAGAISGQAADYLSTQHAINNGAIESNPIYGGGDSVLFGKVAIGTMTYLVANKMGHRQRRWFLPFVSVVGWGAAGWNMSL